MDKKIHVFNNKVRVHDAHLLDSQRERYLKNNVHEEDEEGIFVEIIRGLSPGDVFVNIGTAIGYYPILSKTIRKDIQVHCFEPLRRHLDYFRENLEINGLSGQDFFIHQLAISTTSGEVLFNDNSYASSLLVKSEGFHFFNFLRSIRNFFISKKTKQTKFYVKSIPLSEIFHCIKNTHINFLQMDIQGFEWPVLEKYFADRNVSSHQIKTFLVGTHSAAIHASCLELLRRNGYRILKDIPESLNQPDGIIHCSLA